MRIVHVFRILLHVWARCVCVHVGTIKTRENHCDSGICVHGISSLCVCVCACVCREFMQESMSTGSSSDTEQSDETETPESVTLCAQRFHVMHAPCTPCIDATCVMRVLSGTRSWWGKCTIRLNFGSSSCRSVSLGQPQIRRGGRTHSTHLL